MTKKFNLELCIIGDNVFKNGPSKICGRQPLKNFTWSILEYFVPYETHFSQENNLFNPFNPLSASPKKWLNTVKQFVRIWRLKH